jgi:DNA-binding LytR/AlgR family response regulator
MQPALALVDINLRDGRGAGIGLARELLSRWGIPSLFVSGQRAEAWANRETALGYMSKPYRQETILRSIEVAEHIIEARPPPPPEVPAGLKLFKSTLP